MTSRDFAYWLHGYFEIAGQAQNESTAQGLTQEQVELIKRHLDLVFDSPFDTTATRSDDNHVEVSC